MGRRIIGIGVRILILLRDDVLEVDNNLQLENQCQLHKFHY